MSALAKLAAQGLIAADWAEALAPSMIASLGSGSFCEQRWQPSVSRSTGR
ncbi:MAG: hypothetical protein L0H31_14770 [Nocardioidaceae bacterium]|nr:hypothetical protein [Nocardioidaceae bacterium]